MKKALYTFGKYCLMYLSMLMPRDKKLCVFGAWLGELYADNAKQLFLTANHHPNLKTVWISKNPDIVAEIREAGRRAYLWNSPAAIWYQLRAKYAIMSNGISDLQHVYLGSATLIDLWHGVPLKKICYDNKYEKNWDSPKQRIRDFLIGIPLRKEYYVATSEAFVPIYQSAFRRPKKQILCIGQPRCDIFFQNENTASYFPGKRIILYAPTHRQEGSVAMPMSSLLDLPRLEELLEQSDMYFVVKKHFYHKNEKEDFSAYPHIMDITGQSFDTELLLSETKMLITDYSSIYIDYLLTDRPIFFYCFDYDDYQKNDRELYFPYEEVTPGKKATTFDELFLLLQQALSEDPSPETIALRQQQKEERHRMRDFFFCPTGQGPVADLLLDKVEHHSL